MIDLPATVPHSRSPMTAARPLPAAWERAARLLVAALRPLGPAALDGLLRVAVATGGPGVDGQAWTSLLQRVGWLLLHCLACEGSRYADYAAVPCDVCGGTGQP